MHSISGQNPVMVKMPITGAGSAIGDGALITKGLTSNLGRVVVSPADGVDSIGQLRGAHATALDSLLNGTLWTFADIELNDRYQIVEVEYDQTSADIDVASVSDVTVTITSLEDNIDGAWFYSTSGLVPSLLSFAVGSASGNYTSKTATGWDSTTDVIKILPIGHHLALLNGESDGFDSAAAVGTFTMFNLENSFEDATFPRTLLDPTKHDNLTLSNARFYSKILVRNTAGHTVD